MSFVTDWLIVIYDATVGFHYGSSATTIEVLVQLLYRNQGCRDIA